MRSLRESDGAVRSAGACAAAASRRRRSRARRPEPDATNQPMTASPRHRPRRQHRLEIRQARCLAPQLRRDVHLERVGLDQGGLTPPFRIRAVCRRIRSTPTGSGACRRVPAPTDSGTDARCRARLGGPLAVVANDKVAHGLSERRRFDLDVGLGLDADFHFHQIRQPRLARRDAHRAASPALFRRFRSIAFPDGADGDASPFLSRHSAAGEQEHAAHHANERRCFFRRRQWREPGRTGEGWWLIGLSVCWLGMQWLRCARCDPPHPPFGHPLPERGEGEITPRVSSEPGNRTKSSPSPRRGEG